MNESWPDTISAADGLSADSNVAADVHKKSVGDTSSDSGSGGLEELIDGVVEVASDAVGAVVGAAGELLSGIFD